MKKIKKNVSIIIPAHNEEDIIEETLRHLNFDWIKEIIVVNDGSEDRTLQLIKDYPVKIISFEKNKGKGKSVEEGIKAAEGEILALIDADLGESAGEVIKLLKPVINEDIDMAIGIVNIKGGGLGIVRYLAKSIVNTFSDKLMNAPLSGQRVFHRRILSDIMPLSEGFGLEIGMNLDLLSKDRKFREIRCNFTHRVTGHSINGYIHRFQQLIDILKAVWYKRRYLWKISIF